MLSIFSIQRPLRRHYLTNSDGVIFMVSDTCTGGPNEYITQYLDDDIYGTQDVAPFLFVVFRTRPGPNVPCEHVSDQYETDDLAEDLGLKGNTKIPCKLALCFNSDIITTVLQISFQHDIWV